MMTLFIAAGLYIATALVITGMQPWYALDQDTPLASAFTSVGEDWAATLIAACTVTALSVTALCSLFGQPRIFYRMAKDGLLFPAFGRLTQRSGVPLWGTLFSGVCAGLIALCLDINILSDMISMGTLLAFTTVCAGIVLMRIDDHGQRVGTRSHLLIFVVLVCALSVALSFIDTAPIAILVLLGVAVLVPAVFLVRMPQHPRDPTLYTAPLVPYLPLLGIFCNVYLICSNTILSFYRLFVWTFVGCSLYFLYGMRHSHLATSGPKLVNGALYSPLRNDLDDRRVINRSPSHGD
jgi:APA family basic amino acid/polyamine antiporter